MSFAEAVYIERVDIYETYNCGAVVRVLALGPGGQWTTLWEAAAPERITTARIFTPDITVSGQTLGVNINS